MLLPTRQRTGSRTSASAPYVQGSNHLGGSRGSSYLVAAIGIDKNPAGTVSRETMLVTAAIASRETLHPAPDEGSARILRAAVLTPLSWVRWSLPSERLSADPHRVRCTTGHRQ